MLGVDFRLFFYVSSRVEFLKIISGRKFPYGGLEVCSRCFSRLETIFSEMFKSLVK